MRWQPVKMDKNEWKVATVYLCILGGAIVLGLIFGVWSNLAR